MTQEQREHEQLIVKLVRWFCIAFSIWALSPVVREQISQIYITLLAIVTLILMLIVNRGKMPIDELLICGWIGIVVIYKAIGISDNTWAFQSNIFLFFFTMLTSCFLLRRSSKRFLISTGIIIFCYFTANLAYQFYIYAITGNSLYDLSRLMNNGYIAGGTNFVTASTLYGMLCFTLFYSLKSKSRYIFLGLTIATLYYILNIQTRATGLIVLVLFIFAMLILKGGSSVKPGRVLALVLASIVFLLALRPLVEFLIALEIPYFSRKFTSILNILTGTSSLSTSTIGESSFATRIVVAGVSLDTWLSNPLIFLFGKGYDSGFWNVSGIGQHSELIDLFPKFGIVGFTYVTVIFIRYYKMLKAQINDIGVLFLVVGLIIYSILNGVFIPEVGATFCWMMPFMMMLLSREREEI